MSSDFNEYFKCVTELLVSLLPSSSVNFILLTSHTHIPSTSLLLILLLYYFPLYFYILFNQIQLFLILWKTYSLCFYNIYLGTLQHIVCKSDFSFCVLIIKQPFYFLQNIFHLLHWFFSNYSSFRNEVSLHWLLINNVCSFCFLSLFTWLL